MLTRNKYGRDKYSSFKLPQLREAIAPEVRNALDQVRPEHLASVYRCYLRSGDVDQAILDGAGVRTMEHLRWDALRRVTEAEWAALDPAMECWTIAARRHGKGCGVPYQTWRTVTVRERISLARASIAHQRRLADERAALDELTDDQIAQRAPECLHAANRAAKHSPADKGTIYAVKNAYLLAAVQAGASLYQFKVTKACTYGWVTCECCGHSWVGRDYNRCYACGGDGILDDDTETQTWYVVEVHGYRFHQPGEYSDLDWPEKAALCEPHEPTQPPRGIPEVHVGSLSMSLESLLAVVQRATQTLKARYGAAVAAE